MSNITEIVFILDKSGSMSGLEADTIGGFNSLIKKQKREEGEVYLSTVLFDNGSRVVHDRVPLSRVEPMTRGQYVPSGGTALLDAVGGAIHHIGNIHKYARREDIPQKTLFVITTDGMENSSRRYTYADIKRMISRQQEKYGWEFLFLGANIDAAEAAANIGISRERASQFKCDSEGTSLVYASVNEVMSCARACAPISANWNKKLNDDVKRRGR